MRIIAGDKRGTKLEALEGELTRPTLERVKEGMFSAIQFILPGAAVLDLFAGSGQLGLEALSRGAARCVFIEKNKDAAALVMKNAKTAGLFEKCKVACMDASAYLAQAGRIFDVILLDPPFERGNFEQLLMEVSQVALPGATLLLETASTEKLPEQVGDLQLKKQYRYGTVLVSRYVYGGDEE